MEVINTVGELIDALKQFPADAPVLATWEGIAQKMRVLRVVQAGEKWEVKPGTVLIDAEAGRAD